MSGSSLPPITPPGLHPMRLSERCSFPFGPLIKSSILEGQSHLSFAMIDPITRKTGFELEFRNSAENFVPVASPTNVRVTSASCTDSWR